MSKANVLVVDDQPNVVRVCRQLLESAGYHTEGAASGEEALSLAQQSDFDVILMDLLLPGIDGVEAFTSIRQLNPEAVGIIITGHGDENSAVAALRAGLVDFLHKPFTFPELTNAVEGALLKACEQREAVRLGALIPIFDVSNAVTASQGLKSLLGLVLQIALRESRATRGSLMVVDEESGDLVIGASVGLPQEVASTVRMKPGEGIAGLVAQTRQPLVLTAESAKDPVLRERLNLSRIGSAVCFPLLSRDTLIGVLNLNRETATVAFTESDRDLVAILCSQAATGIANWKLHQALQRSYVSTISALANAVMAKDPYTRNHSDKVSRFSVAVATELGLPYDVVEGIRVAGILHDIGKIGASENILLKPGKLDAAEWEQIKAHPTKGANILGEAEFPWAVVPLVLHHQEKWDGKGYPAGLAGEQIPLGSRILAVTDTFEALTADRAYRKGMPTERALAIINEVRGSQLDPEVTDTFMALANSERLPV